MLSPCRLPNTHRIGLYELIENRPEYKRQPMHTISIQQEEGFTILLKTKQDSQMNRSNSMGCKSQNVMLIRLLLLYAKT